jgi:hypothetical protein
MSTFQEDLLSLADKHQATANDALIAAHQMLQMSIDAHAKAAISQAEADRLAKLARKHFAGNSASRLQDTA